MVLAIDIGNTNIVAGCFDGDKITFIERLSTNQNSTELEYAMLIKNVLEINEIDSKNIEGAIISSVVPNITQTLNNAIEKITGKQPIIVSPGIKTGVSIKIDNPAQLGSDILVGAVAGIAEYSTPLVIIDMGTATTISVIDKNKEYLGGMILPGIRISLNSLVGGTSQLPKISLEPPKKFIGSNTVDAMKSGILYTNACGIDGMIDRIEKELGEKVTAVATGGLSKVVIPLCEKSIILDDELLLKGLRILYNKNKRSID